MDKSTSRHLLSSRLGAPTTRLLIRLGLSPNAITFLGLLLAVASAALLSVGCLAGGGVVLLVAGLFDLLDGAVARATGRATAFGALLDSVADRLSEAAVLLGLLIFYLDESSAFNAVFTSDLGLVLVYIALAGSVMVSYVRARAEALGVDSRVGVMTRPQRVVMLAAGLIVGQWWLPAVTLALGVIATLAVITSVHRVLHVRRALAHRESSVAAGRDSGTGRDVPAGGG